MKPSQKKIITIQLLLIVCVLCMIPTIVSIENSSHLPMDRSTLNQSLDGYTDITVDQAWELLNDTTNGIQYPIDVRFDPEWTAEHIDTPFPEYARHHCKCEWVDETVLQAFIDEYEGKQIILYCKSGGRSLEAAQTLIDNGFIGTIYNMVGGITYWKTNGYPTVPNRAPLPPTITAPTMGIPGKPLNISIKSIDPDFDKISYYVKWGDGQSSIYVDSYPSNQTVVFSHQYDSSGEYTIEVNAKDAYFVESEWSTVIVNMATTELAIDQVKNQVGSISYQLLNTGDFTAENITSQITITGGFFSQISLNHSCGGCSSCGSSLLPGEFIEKSSKDAGFILGFGPIDIRIMASADNADMVTYSSSGFVLGALIL